VFTFEEEIELECITIEVARSSTKEHFIVAPAINRVQYPSKKTPNYGGKLASERMRRAAHKHFLAHSEEELARFWRARFWRIRPCAGGHNRLITTRGDAIIAFALPEM
jgi:hypothetical protein